MDGLTHTKQLLNLLCIVYIKDLTEVLMYYCSFRVNVVIISKYTTKIVCMPYSQVAWVHWTQDKKQLIFSNSAKLSQFNSKES